MKAAPQKNAAGREPVQSAMSAYIPQPVQREAPEEGGVVDAEGRKHRPKGSATSASGSPDVLKTSVTPERGAQMIGEERAVQVEQRLLDPPEAPEALEAVSAIAAYAES